ncbi:MAG: ATP-binding protein, partial [Firmicutes bacterium]|nr:ATP-binding protein [Bacillota bacterium]
MFKYKKVMIATFTLYFLSLSIHIIFACLNLTGRQMLAAIVCGGVMFVVPIVIFATGKLRSFMPFILTTFYIAASLVMSVFNKTAIYLPLLFACETIISGFFLSPKLCTWLLIMSDVVLVLNGALFLPPDGTTVTSYIIMCLCYNFSAMGMALFVYSLQSNLSSYGKKNKELSRSNDRKNNFWAVSASKMRSSAEEVSEIATSILVRNDISAPVREKLREIQADTGKLLMTLNDAEDYAKIESQEMTLSREPYSFGSLVSDIANFCSAACADKSVSFSLDCKEDIPSVLIGDSRRIFQIVMSLFDNAVKFTENGLITVSFTARRSEDGTANLRIQVIDTGTGITPDAAKKIFTVYAEKNGDVPSIHLGLGMVKQLVTLMGGFIFAGREKSGGACFTLTIPQEIQNPQPFAAVEQSEKLRVLLYLKNDGSAEAAQKQLERLGVNSRICGSRSDFMQEKDGSGFTHIFVDYGFYLFDKPIFTMLSRRLKVVVLCSLGDRGENISLVQKNIRVVFKPVHLAMLASIFNNTSDGVQTQMEFTAPDARVLIAGDNTEALKALSVYGIKAVYTVPSLLMDELEKDDYDMVFLGDNTGGAAARILCMEGGQFSDLPVIAVGERSDGCSAALPRGFKQWELG